MDLFDKCRQFDLVLQSARARKRFFYSRAISPAAAPVTTRNGRELINLGASNHLGIAEHPGVEFATASAIATYGTGSAGSRLLTGTTPLHLDMEQALTGFTFPDHGTPILTIAVGDDRACRTAGGLKQEGVFANPAVFPAVPSGQTVIRISLMATHRGTAPNGGREAHAGGQKAENHNGIPNTQSPTCRLDRWGLAIP